MCELKEIADNSCNGHCVLKKELKKLEHNGREFENNLKGKAEFVFIFQSFSEKNNFLIQNFKKEESFFINDKTKSVIIPFFHPPSV